MNVQGLPPEELRQEALHRLVQPAADRHWSIIAPILRRVDQEALFVGYGYLTTLQWAENELGLDSAELARLLELAAMIADAPQVLPEHWRKLSASKAREVLRVVHLGGSPTHWVSAALAAPTTDALRIAIAKHLETSLSDVFVRYSLRMPATSLVLLEAALELALDEALGQPGQPKERIHHPGVAFRCLDVIVAHFVAGYAREVTT